MTQPRVTNPTNTAKVRERTCIASRKRCPEAALLRVVARREANGEVFAIPDPQRKMPGRGAWITPTVKSWEIATKRRAFGRALKVSTQVDANPVREFIESLPVTMAEQNRPDDKRKT